MRIVQKCGTQCFIHMEKYFSSLLSIEGVYFFSLRKSTICHLMGLFFSLVYVCVCASVFVSMCLCVYVHKSVCACVCLLDSPGEIERNAAIQAV